MQLMKTSDSYNGKDVMANDLQKKHLQHELCKNQHFYGFAEQ
jgi:hypothetical protein